MNELAAALPSKSSATIDPIISDLTAGRVWGSTTTRASVLRSNVEPACRNTFAECQGALLAIPLCVKWTVRRWAPRASSLGVRKDCSAPPRGGSWAPAALVRARSKRPSTSSRPILSYQGMSLRLRNFVHCRPQQLCLFCLQVLIPFAGSDVLTHI